MELTPNSNSSLGIGATNPTPIQRSGDDSNVCFESVEKVEKRCEPGVTSGFFGPLVTPGWREGNSNMWNPLESPQFRGIRVGVDPPFHPWSWNWGIPKINSKESELECGIVN